MSYIEENLLNNENIIYAGKIHKFYLEIQLIGVIFGVLFMILGILNGLSILFVFGLAIFIGFLYNIIYINTQEIILTNKRFIYKEGIIARNIFEIQLEKIESYRINQSFFHRIIGTGDFIINGTGMTSKTIKFLQNPIEMKNYITKEIEKKDKNDFDNKNINVDNYKINNKKEEKKFFVNRKFFYTISGILTIFFLIIIFSGSNNLKTNNHFFLI